jgi:DNA-binding NarL/FixJ family response regulator
MSDATPILLIDGKTQDREYYAQYLEASSSHFDVVQAATGRSGLDLCVRQPIDCVVLEIDLPDMSGFEVLARLVPRVSHPGIAVIILTRLPNHFLLELALKNGAQAAFLKTMTTGDILERNIVQAISAVQKDTKRVQGLAGCS